VNASEVVAVAVAKNSTVQKTNAPMNNSVKTAAKNMTLMDSKKVANQSKPSQASIGMKPIEVKKETVEVNKTVEAPKANKT
jgi:hypothetical protein